MNQGNENQTLAAQSIATTRPQDSELAQSLPANGWPPRPFQIVSLLEVLEFYAQPFYDSVYRLRQYVHELEAAIAKRGETDTLTSTESAHLQERFNYTRSICERYELQEAYNRIQNYPARLQQAHNGRSLANTLREIHELDAALRKDLVKATFMYISPDKARYLYGSSNNPTHNSMFDDLSVEPSKRVSQRFPEINQEINAAADCYALEANTACVVQLMRVSELGLRYLASQLKVKLTDRGKAIQIEYATWDKAITACKNKIDQVRKKPVGQKKQARLELYSDAADHFLFMKDIWRNNSSHTRKPYTATEAMAAYERVRDFMRFLAANDF